jgi:hypothetical protein
VYSIKNCERAEILTTFQANSVMGTGRRCEALGQRKRISFLVTRPKALSFTFLSASLAHKGPRGNMEESKWRMHKKLA